MKQLIRRLTLLLSPILCGLLLLSEAAGQMTPSRLKMTQPETAFMGADFPLSLRYKEDVSAADNGTVLDAELMMFGVLPVKSVDVTVQSHKTVLIGGRPFGLRIYTDGLLVSSVSAVQTPQGEVSPADEAGIRPGDVLLSAEDRPLRINEDLTAAVSDSNGHGMRLTVRREGSTFSTVIRPVWENASQSYRLGLHIRDSIAGIGTMTFIDPATHAFAGLGHGICDAESGSLMPLAEGDIVNAAITSVTKGACGSPGSLGGCFADGRAIGSLVLNTDSGVYGVLGTLPQEAFSLPVAFRQEIVRGPARLLTTVDSGEPQFYDIEIEDISYNDRSSSKSMIIHITDDALLRKTGGIVQGMSGSPILQNGCLAGAVTHVFVNDPTRGYAVFAENMTELTDRVAAAPAPAA